MEVEGQERMELEQTPANAAPADEMNVEDREAWKSAFSGAQALPAMRQDSCSPETVVMDGGTESMQGLGHQGAGAEGHRALGFLPEDCFAHALRYLSADQLRMTALVSRTFREMSDCDTLWSRLCLSDWGADSKEIMDAYLKAESGNGLANLHKRLYSKMLDFRIDLKFTSGPRAGEVIRIKVEGETGIGRSRQNDICILQDEMVSRKHARIYYHAADRHFYLKDLGSINGTYINSKTIGKEAEAMLNLHDEVEMGNSIFSVDLAAPGAEMDEDAPEAKL